MSGKHRVNRCAYVFVATESVMLYICQKSLIYI